MDPNHEILGNQVSLVAQRQKVVADAQLCDSPQASSQNSKKCFVLIKNATSSCFLADSTRLVFTSKNRKVFKHLLAAY